MLDEWLDELKHALGIEDDIDVKELLDVARVVAHKVERRAAPVTTYVIGVAAGRAGGDPAAVADASRKTMELARAWEGPAG